MTENVALLLVDDRPENLVALEAVLGNQGLDLVKAASGNDALRHTLKQDFALVLLDVQMPGMDGFETAELMRSNPKTRHLPIIFVTAGMKDIHLQFKGYDLGAVDYLIKPFEPHILQSKVRVFCELYRQRRELESNQLLLESKIRERMSELRDSEERFRMLATHAPVGIYQIDTEGNCLFVNRRWCEIAGLSAAETAGQGWTRTLHPDDRESVASFWQEVPSADSEWSMEYRFLRPDGKLMWVNGHVVALRDEKGKITGYLGNNLEITVKKRYEETIWRQANYDSLTKLPNRRLFRDRLQQEILKAQRVGMYVALLFVDLDRFKEVNDTLGHHTGDLLLIEAARRVCDCVRATDTVARLGGDEFTVIMSGLPDTDRVGEIAQAMLLALATPFTLDAEAVYVSASIGITIFPSDADNVESLLKNADQAMYAAKEQGRNRFSYFTASMQATAQTRLLLSNDLRNAIAAGQLEVYLQPIVELATERIFKAEALLRWHHPTHGMVGPAQFIPIAEETGLINEIGDWAFKEAARTAKRWFDAGLLEATDDGLIQISVNKSPRQFFSGNTHETWIDYLKEIGLPARCIAIEITEGLLLDDRPAVAAKLMQFRAVGFQISLDDFGTGYSSMSYLKKFPLDFLKIDQSFVRDMATDHGDQAIVEAIIVMAHKLGLKVIAEGVETLEQCEMLKAAGCDYGQGYLFARPMPAAEMTLTNSNFVIPAKTGVTD